MPKTITQLPAGVSFPSLFIAADAASETQRLTLGHAVGMPMPGVRHVLLNAPIGTGSGVVQAGGTFANLTVGASAGTARVQSLSGSGNVTMPFRGTGVNAPTWSRRFALGCRFSVSSFGTSNCVARFIGMKIRSSAEGLTGTQAFPFIEINSSRLVRAGWWNGSSASYTSTGYTVALNEAVDLWGIDDGSGNFSVYVNEGNVAVVTHATTDSFSNESNPFVELSNSGTSEAAGITIANPIRISG